MSKRVLVRQIEREVYGDLSTSSMTLAELVEHAVKRHGAEIREHDFAREVVTFIVERRLRKLTGAAGVIA
jgi:hypothetical protein